jgi:hypothetical protein
VDERLKGELALASLSDEDFVERAYGLLLRRPPDAAGRENMAADLRRREISRARALSDIMESEEFGRLLQLDDAVAAGEKARLRRRRLRGLTGPPASDERCGFEKEHDEMGIRDSLAELGRVLAPRGRLLVTVPVSR